jgi:Ca-activated chloride channel family protein
MVSSIPDFSLIHLAKPEFLWLLALLPFLWLRARERGLLVVFARTVIGVLLVVALADPQFVRKETTYRERLFAFDVSGSIAPSMRRWMEQHARGALAPGTHDRVYLFGADAVQSAAWRAALLSDATESPGGVDPRKTNLEKLLSTLLALPARPRSLYLFTDGWETAGNVGRVLPLITGAGLKIFPVVPAEPPKIANVAVTSLQAPNHGTSAEPINLKIAVENYGDRDAEGALTLERNGRSIRSERVKLKPGSHLLTYPETLPDDALVLYRATFKPGQPELDTYAPDNQAVASVAVKTKAKVLLLNGRGTNRYLEEIVKRQGFEVTSRTAEAAPPPAGFSIVILNNVEREKLSSAYLAAIEKHVAAGHGFVMLGNEASFSPGAYRGTAIEALLPVEPKDPPKREDKSRAVVLVIDKSGSMREDNRILYAQEAAKAVVRQLGDSDFISVVGFDVSPFVILPLSPVSSVRKSFDADIERLRAGGRTYLLPAINEAKRQLQRHDVARKHVIILSDGETGGSGGDYIDLVNVMRTELKITVSAVAIGADANLPLMKRITQYGGGFFHHTYDPKTVPRIVLQQIQEAPQNEPAKDRDFLPAQDSGSEILAGFGQGNYPRILGYMDTELKRGARSDVYISGEDRRPPLLASWRYGRGKSVALTMDLESRFSRNWIQWNGLPGFWEKILDWLRPETEPIPHYEARVSLVGVRPVFDLYLYDDVSAASQFSISIPGKNGSTSTMLRKLAPGHFQSPLPISVPGEYKIELTELRRERRLELANLAYSLPYDANSERPQPFFNTDLLGQLAEASGGEINPPAGDAVAEAASRDHLTPTRTPLIALAFLLFLLEVAFRKFVLIEAD